jgi:exodeoxyribonuclease-5
MADGYGRFAHRWAGAPQWDDVVLFDESGAFPDNRDRWLYTGVTRAAKRLTVVV